MFGVNAYDIVKKMSHEVADSGYVPFIEQRKVH